MTVIEVFEQVKQLSPQEQKELLQLLGNFIDVDKSTTKGKTGAEIVAMLETMEPIEFVDEHITDPVEWVKVQRRKEANRIRLDLESGSDD